MTRDFDKEDSFLSSVDVKPFTDKQVEDLQEEFDELVGVLEENEDRVQQALSEVNGTDVMKSLGVELCLDISYDYSTEQKEVRSLGAEFEFST